MKNILSFALLGVLFNLFFFALLYNCGTSKSVELGSYYSIDPYSGNPPEGINRIDTLICVYKQGTDVRFERVKNGQRINSVFYFDLDKFLDLNPVLILK